jgi:hypothetical protein
MRIYGCLPSFLLCAVLLRCKGSLRAEPETSFSYLDFFCLVARTLICLHFSDLISFRYFILYLNTSLLALRNIRPFRRVSPQTFNL